MKQLGLLACVCCVFACASFDAEARELSAACSAKKIEVEQRSKEAYQRWDMDLYNELKQEVRQIERFCTDEKLLEQINARHARQQKKIFGLQQSLEKASEKRKSQAWLDEQTAKLRDANETLQKIEKERNELLASMGQSAPAVETAPAGEAVQVLEGAGGVETPSVLTEPQAIDKPAYNQ